MYEPMFDKAWPNFEQILIPIDQIILEFVVLAAQSQK